MTAATSSSRVIAPAVLLMIVVGVYLPGLSGPFLFDDLPNIVNNEWLSLQRLTPADLRAAALSSDSGPLRRPAATLTFALQQLATGEASAWALKAGNLLLHLLLTVLVYRVAARIMVAPRWTLAGPGSRWFPLVTAAIWALNPLLLSTVLYPVQRMAQLSALFTLAGIYTYLYFRQRWVSADPRPTELGALLLWLGIFFTLGVFSKEIAALLPAFIVLIEFTLFSGFLAGRYQPNLHRLTGLCVALALFGCSLLLWLSLDWVSAGYAIREFSLPQRLWTEARVLWHYLDWFVLPRPGSFGLFHDDIVLSQSWLQPMTTAIAIGSWSAVLIVAYLLRKRVPEIFLAVAFFLIGHALESTVFALELVFEHRNYLPAFGPALLLAALACRFMGFCSARRVSPFLASLPVVALLLLSGTTTLSRSLQWSSELGMASASLAHHPESLRAGYAYGNALLRAGYAATDEQTRNRYLALAGHEFEILAQRNTDDIPSAVMPFVISQQLYADLESGEQWLQALERAVARPPFTASDFNAIQALVDCVELNGCELGQDRLSAILEQFEAGFWRPAAVARLRARMQQSHAAAEGQAERLDLAVADYPGDVESQYMLAKAYLDRQDYGAAHRSLLSLIRADSARRQFPVLRQIFIVPDRPLIVRRAVHATMVLVALVCVAGAIWALAAFIDADYSQAWWVLAFLSGDAVPAPGRLSVAGAIAATLAGAAAMFVGIRALMVGRWDSASFGAVVGACLFVVSPWHGAVLQDHGAVVYAPLLILAALAVLVRRRGMHLPMVTLAAALLMLIALFGWLHASRLPSASPWWQMLGCPEAMLPWSVSPHFESAYGFYCVVLLIVLVSLAVAFLCRGSTELQLPVLVVTLLIGMLGTATLSEVVQTRANPRLALFYSGAHAEPNPMVRWLLSEHFSLIGDADTAADYRRSVNPGDLSAYPPGYAFAFRCIGADAPEEPETSVDPGVAMLARYFHSRGSCPSLVGLPASP